MYIEFYKGLQNIVEKKLFCRWFLPISSILYTIDSQLVSSMGQKIWEPPNLNVRYIILFLFPLPTGLKKEKFSVVQHFLSKLVSPIHTNSSLKIVNAQFFSVISTLWKIYAYIQITLFMYSFLSQVIAGTFHWNCFIEILSLAVRRRGSIFFHILQENSCVIL